MRIKILTGEKILHKFVSAAKVTATGEKILLAKSVENQGLVAPTHRDASKEVKVIVICY